MSERECVCVCVCVSVYTCTCVSDYTLVCVCQSVYGCLYLPPFPPLPLSNYQLGSCWSQGVLVWSLLNVSVIFYFDFLMKYYYILIINFNKFYQIFICFWSDLWTYWTSYVLNEPSFVSYRLAVIMLQYIEWRDL